MLLYYRRHTNVDKTFHVAELITLWRGQRYSIFRQTQFIGPKKSRFIYLFIHLGQ
jgi:hypothetical protein